MYEYTDKVIKQLNRLYLRLFTRLKLLPFDELNRKLTKREYSKAVDHALEIGISNAFIQEGGTVSESFIPDFDMTGV